jgi:ribosomal protein L22
VLRAAKKNGIKKGYSPEQFYVKEVFVGKKWGARKIDIKARGKMGVIK